MSLNLKDTCVNQNRYIIQMYTIFTRHYLSRNACSSYINWTTRDVTSRCSEVPERFHYECHANFNNTNANGLQQAEVTFLFDGDELEGPDMYPIGVITVDSSNPVAVLHEYQLRLRLGKRVGNIDNDTCVKQSIFLYVINLQLVYKQTLIVNNNFR